MYVSPQLSPHYSSVKHNIPVLLTRVTLLFDLFDYFLLTKNTGVSPNATNDRQFSLKNATNIYVNDPHHFIASNDAQQYFVII
jgi:hypothetical protein